MNNFYESPENIRGQQNEADFNWWQLFGIKLFVFSVIIWLVLFKISTVASFHFSEKEQISETSLFSQGLPND